MIRPLLALLLLMSGCAGGSDAGRTCIDGASQQCACANGATGVQTCTNGAFSNCVCGRPPGGVCGDGVCNADETCSGCSQDCGPCPQCNAAPACPSPGVPTSALHRYDLDVRDYPASIPDGGMSTAPATDPKNCKQPQLRLRLSQVTVNTESEKLYFSNIYCMVRADDGVNGEVILTPKTTVLHDGQTFYFDPGEGIFWGQKGLVPTQSNLTITYNCWKVGSDGLAAALDAISKAAAAAGSVAGPWGWAFGLGSVAAAAAAAAAAADSHDRHLLNRQQTIDHATLLDLTNGRTWDIQQDGTGAAPIGNNFGYWDWKLTIESWGCAEVQAPPPTRRVSSHNND